MHWCDIMKEAGAIISGILRIIHPEQYRMAYEMRSELLRQDHVASTLRRWPYIFSALSLISNRETPLHRDRSGRHEWYDILISVGNYARAEFQLSSLGFRTDNTPGTLLAFSGSAIRHGAGEADGDRACYALYMRAEMQSYTHVRPAGFPSQAIFEPLIGHMRGKLRKLSSLSE
ncbi:hypothetical protein K474DRAFT_1631723 [Panus rudis PR-1116 ss-1]|nr:hypothetical protein K474DRAFT_1631723 [Panus rudis PR-1116 ss-1]